MRFTAPFVASLLAATPALAWGDLGHMTVAAVATHYLSSETQTWVDEILGSGNTMVSVSTWADTYRYETEGAWSYNYHFLDAQDNPPTTCDVEMTRDCADSQCIVAAISNYTTLVQKSSQTAAEKDMALKFIIHFFGDITQPLHVENYELGGNYIDVTFKGESTNLHHIWDTNMPEYYIAGDPDSSATTSDANSWGTTIVNKLKSGGSYASDLSSWIACVDPTNSQTCALDWATDSNAYVCSYVLSVPTEDKELDGSYYTNAMPIIEQQLAKGGVRLAAWLNTIVTGSTGF